MTILVGVKCSDGIVVGADSMATSTMGRSPLVQLESSGKLQLVGNKVILATTGSVGLSQRVRAIADKMWDARKFSGDGMRAACELAGQAMRDFQASAVQMSPQQGLGFGALMAAVVERQPYLIEFGTTDFQPELKQGNLFTVSMGSGQVLADPFLAFVNRVLWKNSMPDLETAKIGVFWILMHTITLAPGGVGGAIKLGVIQKEGGDWIASVLEDTQEQAQYIAELEKRITIDEAFRAAPQSEPPQPA